MSQSGDDSGGLFDVIDDAKRERLKALGWYEAVGKLHGRMMWRAPPDSDLLGACVEEAEAFAWLERHDRNQ